MLTRLSLRGQLLALTLGITILMLGSVGLLTYRSASTALDQEGERVVAQLARASAGSLDPAFIRVAQEVRVLSSLPQSLTGPPATREAQLASILDAMIRAIPERYDYYAYFLPDFFPGSAAPYLWYERTATGQVTRSTLNVPGSPTFDPAQEPYEFYTKDWYQQTITATSMVWFEPYIDTGGTNLTLVSAMLPTSVDGQVVGIVGIDLKLEDLNAFVASGRVRPRRCPRRSTQAMRTGRPGLRPPA